MINIILDSLGEYPNSSGMPMPREEVLEFFLEDFIDHELLDLCVSSRPEFDIRTVLEPLAPLPLPSFSPQQNGSKERLPGLRERRRPLRKWRAPEKQQVIDTL